VAGVCAGGGTVLAEGSVWASFRGGEGENGSLFRLDLDIGIAPLPPGVGWGLLMNFQHLIS
jgi:hypothetical protein